MQHDFTFYMKFPALLRNKLTEGMLVFPDNISIVYQPIHSFRVVKRETDDFTPVSRKDFLSYAEEGKSIKARGLSITNDIRYYSVSCNIQLDSLRNLFKLPRPGKKIAEGFVYHEAGPALQNNKTGHVDWWLYDKIKIEGFSLRENIFDE